MSDRSIDACARDIAAAVRQLDRTGMRTLVAIAGPPAVGKSTISQRAQSLIQQDGTGCGLVAMDGFHLDNAFLIDRGLLARKGAPETFDLAGFSALLSRLRTEQEVFVPIFDRSLEKAIGSAELVNADDAVVLVEGNYLLLDEPGWRDLSRHWDFSIFLELDYGELERRLTQRWVDAGLNTEQRRAKLEDNDLPNGKRVKDNRLPCDLVVPTG